MGGAINHATMNGAHDILLVCLSIAIAIAASYTALDLSSRIRASIGWQRNLWLTAAAIALGGGIWAMHFVAMLAFSLPGMEFTYDLALTVLSLMLAIVFTGIGFGVMSRSRSGVVALGGAGLLMGLGVVAMHYVGMAAMRMQAALGYDRLWVAISVLIAVGAAIAALWIASRDRHPGERVGAAILMGIAIAGMHHAGMRAAIFSPMTQRAGGGGEAGITQSALAAAVTATTFLILLLAWGGAALDRRFAGMARDKARDALRLQVGDALRHEDTDEALRQTSALMGAHFGVDRVGYGLLDAAEGVFDYQICWTNGSVPPLLGRYPAAAFGAKIVAALAAGTTVTIGDLFKADLSDEPETRATAGEVDTRAILVVPFLRAGQLRTILYLNSRLARAWRPDEVELLEEIAERTRQVVARAEAEASLRELNAALEQRVRDRTDELQQVEAALRQSQKMQAIGQLTGGIAHDFNNMLTGIMGALDIMKRRIEAGRLDDLGRLMNAATSSAQRAASLTARLLAFSRRQSLDSRPTDVNALIGSLDDLLVRTMGEQIRIEMRLEPDLPAAIVDPHQLESTLLNLAINARDAMPDGGRLALETDAASWDEAEAAAIGLAPGRYVAVTVSDTGTGMSPDVLERAFEPFYTTKPLGQGTGLGLSMVYGFAQQSGGQVRIRSVPGEGTQVDIFLPAGEHGEAETTPEPTRPVRGAGQRVLLVEDDDSVRLLVQDILGELGYQSVEAATPEAAIALLEAGETFDLLISDVGLPGMNGRQLAEIARGHLPDLPVLFMTGYAENAADRGAFLGADMQLITKPFQMETLAHNIQEMLGGG